MIFILTATVYSFIKNNNSSLHEDWTIMIYMSGDNNLSPIVQEHLGIILDVGSGNHLSIVVLADESSDGDSHLYYLKKGKLIEKDLKNIWMKYPNEVDTGNPRTLTDFGKWAIENYPADRYMLIMWGHGDGWKGLAGDKGGSHLSMIEFSEALDNIVQANGGMKLDIIGFDACTMATLEAYYEVAPCANYLVASEKKEPDAGWPYKSILKELKNGNISDPEDLSKTIVKRYIKAYKSGDLPGQDFSVGMSAMRTKEDSTFTASFQRFVNALESLSEEEESQILGLRDDALVFEDKNNIDLLAYVQSISQVFPYTHPLTQAAFHFLSQAKKVIIAEDHWDNPDSNIKMTGSTGLCIYYPKGHIDNDYSSTELARVSAWDEFISI